MKKPLVLGAGSDAAITDEAKIEFPCDYPIKAIGSNQVDLKAIVIDIVKQYAPDLKEEKVTLNASSKGNFVSVRFSIWATGKEQLKQIHEALMATGHVKLVL